MTKEVIAVFTDHVVAVFSDHDVFMARLCQKGAGLAILSRLDTATL